MVVDTIRGFLVMIVNNERKFVFVSVPKTGCTSIMAQLDPGACAAPPDIYHSGLQELDLDRYGDYFKFGFVRHPLERFVSMYFESIRDEWHIKVWSKDLLRYSNINDFVNNIETDPLFDEVHFIPQYKFFYKNDINLADKIYRYENYNESCEDINQRLGLRLNSSIRLRNSNRTNSYDKYLDRFSIEKLCNFYQKDLELFYEMPTLKPLPSEQRRV